jgi:lantibiotic modifying enzyme
MGADLYEGSAGIARFLGLAAALSGDAVLKATALGALRHALATAEGWPLFTGGMGIGLVALELAGLLDEPDLITLGTRLVEQASLSASEEGLPFDFLVGTAGVVVGLVAARHYDSNGDWVARAFHLGQGLLAAAVPEGPEGAGGRSLSWPLIPRAAERLCGLAHGASGVALAFEALARLTPEAPGWRAAAQQARNYERAHYSQEAGSWAALRLPGLGMPDLPAGHPHMWCHGSIGVTAERLGALDHDLLARADAVGGLAGARAHAEHLLIGPVGPGAGDALNGSLCHGLAGLIDLFVDAWRFSGETCWLALAGEVGDLMQNDARRVGGWRSGVPGGWSAPGLMLGNAGIGWALLRLANPERVPSGWRVEPRART